MAVKQYRIPVGDYLDIIEGSHGFASYQRSIVTLAVFIYIHNTYGLEGSVYQHKLRGLRLSDEVLILDIANHPNTAQLLSGLEFGAYVTHIKEIRFGESMLIIEVE